MGHRSLPRSRCALNGVRRLVAARARGRTVLEAWGRIWTKTEDIVTSRLTHVEAAAALAQARRLGRISAKQHRGSVEALDALWSSLRVVDVDQALAHRAAEVAASQSLRAYDATHGASAALVASDETVGVSGDEALLAAWSNLGLAAIDVTRA